MDTPLICSYAFSAGVQQRLPSQLVPNRFFFLDVLVLHNFHTCHDNQMKWPVDMKDINWVDNHQMIITAKYGSNHFTGYGENAIQPFSHYKSMEAFCCHGKQTKRQITIILAVFNCYYLSNICNNKLKGRSP